LMRCEIDRTRLADSVALQIRCQQLPRFKLLREHASVAAVAGQDAVLTLEESLEPRSLLLRHRDACQLGDE
jgi:hypothetical protein